MGQIQIPAPAPSAHRHSGVSFVSFALAIISLGLSIAGVSGLTFWLWYVGTIGWALFAAMLAFGLGVIGASLKGRKRLHASLGMYLSILALAIQAVPHFLWLGLHVG